MRLHKKGPQLPYQHPCQIGEHADSGYYSSHVMRRLYRRKEESKGWLAVGWQCVENPLHVVMEIKGVRNGRETLIEKALPYEVPLPEPAQ